MKRFIFLLILCAQHIAMFAYVNFIAEGKTWVVECTQFTVNGSERTTETFVLRGDTVIGGVTYKCLLGSGDYLGAFREEGEKVFFANTSGTESLYYDFSLHIGDKADIHSHAHTNEFEVYLEDSIQSGGPALRRLGLYYSNEPETAAIQEMQSQWIEGVGSLWGPLFSLHFDWAGATFSLLSCKVGDEVLYQFEPTYFPEGTKWSEILLDTSRNSSWFTRQGDEWRPNFELLEYYVEGEISDRYLRYTKVFCRREGKADSLAYLIQVMGHGREDEVHVTYPEIFDANGISHPVLTYNFDWKVGETLEYQTLPVSQQVYEYDVQKYGTIEEILEGYFGGVHPLKYVDLGAYRIIQGIGLTSWEGRNCIFGPANCYESSLPEAEKTSPCRYRSMLVHFERDGQVLYDVWPMPGGEDLVGEIKRFPEESSVIFDLSGRPLSVSSVSSVLTKGIYIKDGKKVVIK